VSQQTRGLVHVRGDPELASGQFSELRSSLAAIKCALSDALVCDHWDDTEAIVRALTATETDIDQALAAEVASNSAPRPSAGRRSAGPDSPMRRSSLHRTVLPPSAEPAAASEIRMLLFRLSHSLERLERLVMKEA